MGFIYISPHFPKTGWRFCDRLKKNGVKVFGIADCNYEELDPTLKSALTDYYKVSSLENYDEVYRAVAYFAFKYGKIEWIESNNEHWLEQDAKLRDDFNVKTGWGYSKIRELKSKSKMKAYYDAAKVPVARYHLVNRLIDAERFIRGVGYPVVVKPDVGVGAAHTYKITNRQELQAFYTEPSPVPYIMEEYISGNIQTYDAIINAEGEPIFETSFICLPVMDTVNDGTGMEYYVVKDINPKLLEMGRRTVKSFGIKRRFVHFEFFKLDKPKKGLGDIGDYMALEANMRPAGGYTPEMYNFAGSVDVYKIYADMVAYNKSDISTDRSKFICSYAGRFDRTKYLNTHEQIMEKFGSKIVMCERMPDVLAGAMGNQMYTAKLNTEEERAEFKDFVLATK